MIDKVESRRLRVAIRQVLLDVWDPCGVKGNSSAVDEYDAYLGNIFELLTSGASEQAIADHLLWVERERMGLLEPGRAIPATVSALKLIQLPPATE